LNFCRLILRHGKKSKNGGGLLPPAALGAVVPPIPLPLASVAARPAANAAAAMKFFNA